jgi:Spy/CpxP family protein refolding chaperone
MSEPRRSGVVAGVVIVLVLLAGVAIGYFLHHAVQWRHGPPGFGVGGPPSGPPPQLKGRMLERLDRELKLTPEQHAKIDSVLTRREADLRALMTETRPRFDSIAVRTRSEIKAVLTPEQQEEFGKIVQRMEAQRGHRRGQ